MTDDIPGGRPLTFGLVGTGYWARVAHARALASVPEIKFAAVWGRNTEAAAGLAAEFGITAHVDFDAFLAEVDAVAFSVPPDVQSELAVLAARAGKHVLRHGPHLVRGRRPRGTGSLDGPARRTQHRAHRHPPSPKWAILHRRVPRSR